MALSLVACAVKAPPTARPAPAGPIAAAPTGSDLADRVFAPKDASSTPVAAPSAATPMPVPITAESMDRGSRLFGMKGCAVCHGPRAEGNVGPRLAGTPLSRTAVLRQVRTPYYFMPPFPPEDLSDGGVADIYAFLQSLDGP